MVGKTVGALARIKEVALNCTLYQHTLTVKNNFLKASFKTIIPEGVQIINFIKS